MECIFIPETNQDQKNYQINSSELKHLKALRLKNNEKIMISNGKGLCLIAEFNQQSAQFAELNVIEVLPNYGETTFDISILICNLSDKTRMEWLIEKAVELGVKSIYIANCRYSQFFTKDSVRFKNKAIAALKQCKRATLLELLYIDNLSKEFDRIQEKFDNIILLDVDGSNPLQTKLQNSVLLLIGAEGGFHPDEIAYFQNFRNFVKWNLGNRRLRAETAALNSISIASSILDYNK
jgi:16S rRNA (uracil1498-N3)-methyltransferase